MVRDQSEGPLMVWERMEEPNNIKKKKKKQAEISAHVVIMEKWVGDSVCALMYLFLYSLYCAFAFFTLLTVLTLARYLCSVSL